MTVMHNEASILRSGGGQKSCKGWLMSSVYRLELQVGGLQRALPPLLLSWLPLPPPTPGLGQKLGSGEGGDHSIASLPGLSSGIT